jgi:hypothetical protein
MYSPLTCELVSSRWVIRTSGEYSLKALTKTAAAAGLTNRTGGGALARSRIHQVLQHSIYYGEFYWSSYVAKNPHGRRV